MPETDDQTIYSMVIKKDGDDSIKPMKTDRRPLGKIWNPKNRNLTVKDVYFQSHNGEQQRLEADRLTTLNGGSVEELANNKTLGRLVLQQFENEIASLPDEERLGFPVSQNHPAARMDSGIFISLEEWDANHPGDRFNPLDYILEDGSRSYFLKHYNLFSEIPFASECLLQWGDVGDMFVLEYTDSSRSAASASDEAEDLDEEAFEGEFAETGELADDIARVGVVMLAEMMREGKKNLILRGAPGTGKSHLAKELAAYLISNGATTDFDGGLEATQQARKEFVQFHPSFDYTDFVGGLRPTLKDGEMRFTLEPGIFMAFVEKAANDPDNDYVFIIDEINRGEISKIFGELFYAVDPGYRGVAGTVKTQYANMATGPGESFFQAFYIPENVYLIGTMNDIDRSVDSFDFAMRRRFAFYEVLADENLGMLRGMEKALRDEVLGRMDALNQAITREEDLNENYCIGGAYFKDVQNADDLERLWRNSLKPLLQDYVQGMGDEEGAMKRFKEAFFGSSHEGERGE